ncbi:MULTISPECIES: ABC transporter substrate-binding protein [unclassified Curtobacterium]|jgi:branched-chain amino acid transport system substrate-binding protein|uniref:ABC transporter substrate-binding protein n=1 Tax=unclassified Curtobacterium TaxID=257496 RepID=UPI00052A50DA|nr:MULTISPECIES: ABC transporter substrate-binding protein [unclassified Curtobacterium]AIV41036.1 ABC transporter substrate-binding protein [Curtobacterium sp. MR_MD2014]MBP1302502.1 branched-chain amino acid transport system substrate-binding protein [Curtobacterium sp. 1310]MCM3505626.1 ABC transporter substrate-binding protein [Curtobacterium sp. ODYSSEY 48 V2]MCM3522881.1 ABC transporter substrate-binding protein [Curtobacterium sp. P97]MDB6427195.1 ABC transporter substrate-binding prote
MTRTTRATTALAVAGAAALLLAACSTSGSAETTSSASAGGAKKDPAASCKAPDTPGTDALKIGTILPLTGTLSYLNPPAESGVGLAVEDINSAGGVLDKDVSIDPATDSGDSNDMTVSSSAATKLVNAKVPVVIGAESSSVTLNVIDQLTSNCIVQISPANTATDLSGYSSHYYRTAPPDSVQGSALGQLVTGDGNAKVAFLVFNDTYGTGLRDTVQQAIEDSGGQVVYGGKGKGQEFPPGQTTFSSEVTAALAAKPDAIVVLAFDETKSIIPELKSQNADMSKIYMSDGNTADYSKDFDPGTLEGAQGTIPGASPKDELKQRLSDFYKQSSGKELADYSYAAESYDATTLAALAAVKGKGTDSGTIQANMAAVSGADGGTKCETFKACKDLLDKGEDIQYTGPSGIGPFDSKNDPSSAYIGIYKFDGDNKPVYQTAIQGSVSK